MVEERGIVHAEPPTFRLKKCFGVKLSIDIVVLLSWPIWNSPKFFVTLWGEDYLMVADNISHEYPMNQWPFQDLIGAKKLWGLCKTKISCLNPDESPEIPYKPPLIPCKRPSSPVFSRYRSRFCPSGASTPQRRAWPRPTGEFTEGWALWRPVFSWWFLVISGDFRWFHGDFMGILWGFRWIDGTWKWRYLVIVRLKYGKVFLGVRIHWPCWDWHGHPVAGVSDMTLRHLPWNPMISHEHPVKSHH